VHFENENFFQSCSQLAYMLGVAACWKI